MSTDKAKVWPSRGLRARRELALFDPWLACNHRLVAVVRDNLYSAFEMEHAARRKRKPKARDVENRRNIFEAVYANLALAVASGRSSAAFKVSMKSARRATTRYDRAGFTGLPAIIEWLASRGVVTFKRSSEHGDASEVREARVFRETVSRFAWRDEHFGEVPGRETVLLGRTERGYEAGGWESYRPRDYPDHPDADRYRIELGRINARLASANIAMLDDGGPAVVTLAKRRLLRHFNYRAESDPVSFDLGGRLFGGWWQGLPAARRSAIRIGGEPIADLDFKNMALRLAYLEAGKKPPRGDLYGTVQGFDDRRWREGLKLFVSALLFREGKLTRKPKDSAGMLPPSMTAADIRSAILAAHPVLEGSIERGIGHRLMFLESQILVAALLMLDREGIPALPMHDGLMVAASKADIADLALSEAAQLVVGFRLPVELKASA